MQFVDAVDASWPLPDGTPGDGEKERREGGARAGGARVPLGRHGSDARGATIHI